MGRLVVFVVLVLLLARLLTVVPWIGPFFARHGFLGIWVVAIVLSLVVTRYGARAVRIQRGRTELRRLEGVSTLVNHGKAGTLLLKQGRPRKAVPHLRAAAEGEPETAEWHYRLGAALLRTSRSAEAVEVLHRCVEIDQEHAYGAAQMRLARALRANGQPEAALEALGVFERNHGPSPESRFRRGRVLRLLGRREEARASYDEVGRLARQAARYQRREALGWRLRAALVRWF